MRIGILTSWPLQTTTGSGMVTAIRGLALGLDALGERVHFVSPVQPSWTTTGTYLRRIRYNGRLPRLVRRATRRDELDRLIGFDFDGCYLEQRWRPPLTAFCGGTLADILPFESGWARMLLNTQARLEAQQMAQADEVIVPSLYAADAVHRHYDPSGPLRVVPLAVDAQGWASEESLPPDPLPEPPVVLAVARCYRRKGIDLLLAAWESARERIGSGTLVVVGSGPESGALRRQAAGMRHSRSVHFTGEVSDRAVMRGWYESSDLFALPSRHETFGLVYLEAGLHGLPVVALAATAVPEVIEDGKNGLLVSTGEEAGIEAELADAISLLLLDAPTARRLGDEGRRRALQRSWTDAARELLAPEPLSR